MGIKVIVGQYMYFGKYDCIFSLLIACNIEDKNLVVFLLGIQKLFLTQHKLGLAWIILVLATTCSNTGGIGISRPGYIPPGGIGISRPG